VPHAVRPELPRELSDLIQRMLAKDPAARPASARAVADALATSGNGSGPTSSGSPANRPRSWQLVLAGAVVALALGGGIWWMVTHSPEDKGQTDSANGGQPSVPEPPAPKKQHYHGELHVLVERIVEPGMPPELLTLDDPRTLPLRQNDKFRIEAEVKPAAYLYLVLVNPGQDVDPFYPWNPVKGWGSRPAVEMPVTRVSLPKAAEKRYKASEAKPGVATLVLLARSTPLDVSDEVVRGWFQKLPDLPLPQGRDKGVVWFDDYQPVTGDRKRAGTIQVEDSDNPFAVWQGLLQRAVGDRAAFQTAVSFARIGRD
jgi:hypothetical protein